MAHKRYYVEDNGEGFSSSNFVDKLAKAGYNPIQSISGSEVVLYDINNAGVLFIPGYDKSMKTGNVLITTSPKNFNKTETKIERETKSKLEEMK
jgi:hypothetical protein